MNDLMNFGKFISDRREVLIATLKRIDPTYEPVYTKPQIQYECDLVNNLNHRTQPILLSSEMPEERIFLNSNINQLEDEFFDTLKHKSSKEILDEQLHTNIITLFNRKINLGLNLDSGRNVLSNSNTYHPLSLSISNFERIKPEASKENSTSNSLIKNYIDKFIKSPAQITQKIDSFKIGKGGIFEAQQLRDKAKEQMLVESKGFVMVDSIEKQCEPTEIVNHFVSIPFCPIYSSVIINLFVVVAVENIRNPKSLERCDKILYCS